MSKGVCRACRIYQIKHGGSLLLYMEGISMFFGFGCIFSIFKLSCFIATDSWATRKLLTLKISLNTSWKPLCLFVCLPFFLREQLSAKYDVCHPFAGCHQCSVASQRHRISLYLQVVQGDIDIQKLLSTLLLFKVTLKRPHCWNNSIILTSKSLAHWPLVVERHRLLKP